LHTTRAEKVSKIRPEGGSVVLPTDIEESVAAWARGLRADGIPVTREMITRRVLGDVKEMPEYAGSGQVINCSKDSRRGTGFQ
jgi:hypothetical protein